MKYSLLGLSVVTMIVAAACSSSDSETPASSTEKDSGTKTSTGDDSTSDDDDTTGDDDDDTTTDSGTTDSGAAGDSGMKTDSGPAGKKRVFVSSDTYYGDLKNSGKGATAREGANKLCNELATAASLGGTWKAWLSVEVADKAPAALTDVGPWYLTSPASPMVFANLAATSSPPLTAIDYNEKGVAVGISYPVWTGTQSSGNASVDTCNGWSSVSPSYSGMRGAANSTTYWTQNGASEKCNEKKAIYCFEQ